ncbi:hypothetical protein [Rhodoferax saidenbachensis]|uniref:hypothetical protein n=1 Tax=Rhodoferax saidenbachensis TaxID=1484693 RepID=UPI001268CC2A|nr:hypothetical protein [Rhodoferax saidenbachensis]
MEVSKDHWRHGGAALLFGVSSLIFAGPVFTGGVMSVWVPMPIHLVVLAWTTLVLFVFLTPGLYLLTLKFAANSRHFPIVVLGLITAVATLNSLYFYGSWEYGTRYQGIFHTQVVASENTIGFAVALLISVWGVVRKSPFATYLANLLLFVLLSWCAFPYLGEFP